MSDLLQILEDTSAKPRVTFSVNGAPSDLDTGVPTVVATRPDGTVFDPALVASHVAPTGSGIYEVSYPAQTDPTVTTLAWTGVIGSVSQTVTTYVEVVGALLFTTAQLRALKVAGSATPKFASTTVWPDTQLHDARTAVLGEFTEILGFSPVPRHRRAILSGNGRTCLTLPDLMPHRLISVTVNGAAQDLAGYDLNSASQIEAVSGYSAGTPFTWGRRNVVVEYVHGLTRVPGDGSNIAMIVAAAQLDPSVFSSASTVVVGNDSYSFDPAGQVTQAGTIRHYGIPKVDAWLNRWAQPSVGVA